MKSDKFIRYPEAFNIINQKYNITHDELKYTITSNTKPYFKNRIFYQNVINECILPLLSDLPTNSDYYHIPSKYYDPAYCFYSKEAVDNFKPDPLNKFIYIKDLPLRLWSKWDRVEHETYSEYPSLDFGAKYGMLRFYDKDLKEFTLEKTFSLKQGNETLGTKVLWYRTLEGQSILSDPHTFFLLEDIIHIERVFNRRAYEDCMKELGYSGEGINDSKEKLEEIIPTGKKGRHKKD